METGAVRNKQFPIWGSFLLVRPPLMRAAPAETGRELIQTDMHALRKGARDPDKEEINIGRRGMRS